MDNIFGIGLPELILILVIAGMVMGPERIARTARSLGALTARLQAISRTFLRQLNAELDAVDETGQIKSTVEELDQLRRQVADLRKEVFTLATGTAAETKQVTKDLRREIENSIMPPGLDSTQKKLASSSKSENDGLVLETPSRSPAISLDDPPKSVQENNDNQSSRVQPVSLPSRVNIPEDPDK